MCVIFDAANFDRLEAVIPGDTGHVGPKFRLQYGRDALLAIFNAEHNMNAITRIGM
jgi:hypothetical protein